MSSQITFTELENKVLEAIRSLIADGYELIYMGDLQYCGLDLKKARGAMASLVKKNAIYVDRDSDGLISLLSAGELPAIEKEVIGEEGASQLVSRVEGVIIGLQLYN